MSSKLSLMVLLLLIVALSCTLASESSSNELKFSDRVWSGPASETSSNELKFSNRVWSGPASETSSNELKFSNRVWSGHATEVSKGLFNPARPTLNFDFNTPSVFAGIKSGFKYIARRDAKKVWMETIDQFKKDGAKLVIAALDGVYRFTVGSASLWIENNMDKNLILDGNELAKVVTDCLDHGFNLIDPNNPGDVSDFGTWVTFHSEPVNNVAEALLNIGITLPPDDVGASG